MGFWNPFAFGYWSQGLSCWWRIKSSLNLGCGPWERRSVLWQLELMALKRWIVCIVASRLMWPKLKAAQLLTSSTSQLAVTKSKCLQVQTLYCFLSSDQVATTVQRSSKINISQYNKRTQTQILWQTYCCLTILRCAF